MSEEEIGEASNRTPPPQEFCDEPEEIPKKPLNVNCQT